MSGKSLAAAAFLALACVSPGLMAAGERGDASFKTIAAQYGPRVVGVTYVLRPREKPTGGEGRRVEDSLCGVIVDDAGLVIVSGDPFPDPGGDPKTTLVPVEFKVHARNGRPLDATAIGFDRELNLAYLRLKDPPRGLAPLRFRDSPLDIGDRVAVIGVLSSHYGYAPVVNPAMINAVVDKPRRMYSLDLPVQDLSIGGLVIDAEGRPVGLVGEDVLLDAPVNDRMPGNALSLFGSLTQGRRVGYPMIFPASLFAAGAASPPPLDDAKRSWLGIIMQPLADELIAYWKLDVSGGIIISSVVNGSPADKAGLETADILIALQGEPLLVRKDEDLADFRRRIERMGVGRAIDLTYLRAGERRDVSLTLAEAPLSAFSAREMEDDHLGLTVRDITMDDLLGQSLDPGARGVVVADLEHAGWAQLAGLQIGDIIEGVDGHPIEDVDAFRRESERLQQEKPAATLFFVRRQTETLFVRLRTPWSRPIG